ncbi:MAG: type II toxin-antitoxin system Phd/YefM family antitoxin [Acidimicrobiales bacterium]
MSEARERLSEAVELAGGEAVFLERYGKPAAVLLNPERYEELMEVFEDAEDVAAFDASMADRGENIPWAHVKADLVTERTSTAGTRMTPSRGARQSPRL